MEQDAGLWTVIVLTLCVWRRNGHPKTTPAAERGQNSKFAYCNTTGINSYVCLLPFNFTSKCKNLQIIWGKVWYIKIHLNPLLRWNSNVPLFVGEYKEISQKLSPYFRCSRYLPILIFFLRISPGLSHFGQKWSASTLTLIQCYI